VVGNDNEDNEADENDFIWKNNGRELPHANEDSKGKGIIFKVQSPDDSMKFIIHILRQDDHYKFRPKELEDITFLEFCCCFEIIKQDDHEQKDDKNKKLERRHKNSLYLFSDLHPLCNSHCIKQLSKPKLPILAGPPPPTFRSVDNNDETHVYAHLKKEEQKRLDFAARYYLVLCSP
jgi:hypothetical protein